MTTILKPASMARIAVIGLKKYRPQLISILHEMNVIQLEPLSKEADYILVKEHKVIYIDKFPINYCELEVT